MRHRRQRQMSCLSPSPHERWLAAMRGGDFEQAWRETDILERPRRAGGIAGERNLLWDGRDLRGRRVLVRCLHGLGDTLQFSRFLPALNTATAELVVAAQPPLVEFLGTQAGIGRVRNGWERWRNDEGFAEVEIMELAYVFRACAHSLPAPHLCVNGDAAAPLNRALEVPGPRVAVFWAASGWGGRRHIPLSAFDQLTGYCPAKFFSFQQGSSESEAGNSRLRPVRLSHLTSRISDLAAALSRMDLVLAVDSMPAHLAASLGRRVWLLLEPEADWRWMDDREDTPWYPTMRIFRQAEPTWDAAMDRIGAELRSFFAA